MRRDAGLDGLSCCDYLRLDNNRVILIEATHLAGTMDEIERDLGRVRGDEDARRKFIRDTVRERVVREHARKVCGSLLMMCRAKVAWEDRRHVLWLVVGGDSIAALRRMDSRNDLENALLSALCGNAELQSSLQGGLRSAKLVDQAELITVAELRKRLPGPR